MGLDRYSRAPPVVEPPTAAFRGEAERADAGLSWDHRKACATNPRFLICPVQGGFALPGELQARRPAESLKDEKQNDFGYKGQETRHGGCSSVVEHWIVAPVVAGSIPVIHPIQSEEEERLR